jgi:hypothetical protein
MSDEEKPYDVVIDTLQKQRDKLWEMTQRNLKSDYIGINIMDQIRLKHIDTLDDAMECWKKYKHEWIDNEE